MLFYFWKLPNTVSTDHIVLMIKLMKHLEVTELVRRAASEQMRRQIGMAVQKQKPSHPDATIQERMKLHKSGSPGPTVTHDSHNSYSISTGNATCPVFFISMDRFVFFSATTENTCLLSLLDFPTHNVNMSSSWLQSQWQKSVCEQPEGSHQFIFPSDKAIFRLEWL